jgi:hypothetical protein
MKHRIKSLLTKFYFPIQFILLGCIIYNINFLFVFTTKHYKDIPAKVLGHKYNIVVVSSYNLGENQQAQHTCIAANNLGWECRVLSFDERVVHYNVSYYYMSLVKYLMNYYVKPDFVLYINPSLILEEDVYPKYATLDILNYDVLRYRETGKFDPSYLKWMSKYQGFLIFGNDGKWFEELRGKLAKFYDISGRYLTGFYPSVYQVDFKESAKNTLFYCGANWDATRGSEHYKEIYKALDKKDYFQVYGPYESWGFLENSYKGMIPIDEYSLINKMQTLGITLVLHSNLHLKYNIVTKRIFEAATASNVVISDLHPAIVEEFGDCVYYIDPQENSDLVVAKIDNIIRLLQADKQLANQKAKCIYDIFSRKFTLENQLMKLVGMHETIFQETTARGLNE